MDLTSANLAFNSNYPGERPDRQPVHTVYGGAQLFKAETAQKLGEVARKSLKEFASCSKDLARILGWTGSKELHETIYKRITEKLDREPVEDFRIDFEDGYGNRPDAEEDGHAKSAAEEVARGMQQGLLPPYIGIRIKPFTEELKSRSFRTLDLFLTTLLQKAKTTPPHFFITLPKVTIPEQSATLNEMLSALEPKLGLSQGKLKTELMVETTQAIIGWDGRFALPALFVAAGKRCAAAHFGTYDYTASCNITAAYQTMDHPACDFAKNVMKVSLGSTGLWLSDGATNVMPVGDAATVHRAWKTAYDHIRHSLKGGFYQGWDLHPAQLPIRYAAVYSFFLESLSAATQRLKAFMDKAAQATLLGDVFDDAATGQGLLNYFLRGLNCGAISEEEALATGLTREEIQTRSFVKILANRKTNS
jgi:citrate lyase beta subunit